MLKDWLYVGLPVDEFSALTGYSLMTFRFLCFFPTCTLVALSLTFASLSAQHLAKNTATPAAVPEGMQTIKQTFTTLEVAVFENEQDSHFPVEYTLPLQAEIKKQLVNAKVFSEVILGDGGAAASGPPSATPRVLRLTGTITSYNPGSRSKRYFAGFGAGAAEIDSRISFVDAVSGQVLMTQDLRALLTGGFFGGKAEDALKDYARQVVNKVKLMQNMRVPAPGETIATMTMTTETPGLSDKPVRLIVPVTDEDWVGCEQKLNQYAADGYRLNGLTITGPHSADAAMIRTDAIAATFQYKLLRTILSTSLAKDINKLAVEGFRVSPHTLVIMGTRPVVVVEKSSPPFKDSYLYMLKETLLVSSGHKNVEELQKQGYTLVGESEHGTAHILLFEKASPAK
jgi:hypothetical protein